LFSEAVQEKKSQVFRAAADCAALGAVANGEAAPFSVSFRPDCLGRKGWERACRKPSPRKSPAATWSDQTTSALQDWQVLVQESEFRHKIRHAQSPGDERFGLLDNISTYHWVSDPKQFLDGRQTVLNGGPQSEIHIMRPLTVSWFQSPRTMISKLGRRFWRKKMGQCLSTV
jgi:hypothetical protein